MMMVLSCVVLVAGDEGYDDNEDNSDVDDYDYNVNDAANDNRADDSGMS